MIFEDLAAAALQHCLLRNGAKHAAIRTEPVITGRKKGPWLDRWIEADLADSRRVLFQTEIKSVSAHSTGHKRIMLNASQEELSDHEQENRVGQWNSETNTLIDQPMAKVLAPMKPPAGTENRRLLPLLIYRQPGPVHTSGAEMLSSPHGDYRSSVRTHCAGPTRSARQRQSVELASPQRDPVRRRAGLQVASVAAPLRQLAYRLHTDEPLVEEWGARPGV